MDVYAYISVVFLLAGFVQGLTGFGSALVAIPILTLFIDVKEAVPLTVLNGLVISLVLSLQLKKNIMWDKIFPLLAGIVPGILTGMTILKNVSSANIKFCLGIMLIAYGFYGLRYHIRQRKLFRIWGCLAGFGSGAIGAAFAAGGPPAIIYLTLTGRSKNEIKATLAFFFLINSIMTAAAHAAGGLTTRQVLYDFSVSFIFLLLGIYTGIWCYRKFKTEGYRKIVLLFLIITGILMIVHI
ncbi:MAG: sulfite exporter TauE/SafE family protein [Desulfobacterales bacterium]|nr:sulfite exporter TauE/SafE family protein [Desulfobacterales bacterium]